MKANKYVLMVCVLCVCICILLSAKNSSAAKGDSDSLIEQGVVYTLQWTDGSGKTHGLSRLSHSSSIPGGNGSFNMDMYARLYPTHIEIINRHTKDLGSKIIPIERLDFVQFGEDGVKHKGD
jgi:hypothetical protein